MSAQTTVFYLTATHVQAPLDAATGKRARTELAKFFTYADAEKHEAGIRGTWIQVLIEERVEQLEAQHEAHRKPGTSGKAAALARI